jgi:hypothetical protein
MKYDGVVLVGLRLAGLTTQQVTGLADVIEQVRGYHNRSKPRIRKDGTPVTRQEPWSAEQRAKRLAKRQHRKRIGKG